MLRPKRVFRSVHRNLILGAYAGFLLAGAGGLAAALLSAVLPAGLTGAVFAVGLLFPVAISLWRAWGMRVVVYEDGLVLIANPLRRRLVVAGAIKDMELRALNGQINSVCLRDQSDNRFLALGLPPAELDAFRALTSPE